MNLISMLINNYYDFIIVYKFAIFIKAFFLFKYERGTYGVLYLQLRHSPIFSVDSILIMHSMVSIIFIS